MSLQALVVDDDPSIQGMLDLSLGLEGVDVRVASDGASGLEMALSHPPDVILLDIMMPAMNGLEVLKHLRDGSNTKDVPVILLTAKAAGDEIWTGWRAGADSYITKPFDIEVLISEMYRVCRAEGEVAA